MPHTRDPRFPEIRDLPKQGMLPDPFLRLDGGRVASREEWEGHRAYLKALLCHYQYGHMPPRPEPMACDYGRPRPVLDGRGVEVPFTMTVARNGRFLALHAAVVVPPGDGPFPVVVKNDRVLFLAAKDAARRSVPETVRRGIRADDAILPLALARGYAMAKFNRTELAEDRLDNRAEGVFPLYPEYDWGTIAAWAWGYGLVIDALAALPCIDRSKIVATGHSRGGKTALCAAIFDERIALAAPNSSGTGGTGSLRCFEEGRQPHQTLAAQRGVNDHWWGPRFLDFAGQEDRLPFDAHTAKALVAPRALLNPHALADYWANPYGTEITHLAAQRVYAWLGCPDRIAMHWREGGHAQDEEDWTALLDFADTQFRGRQPARSFARRAYPDATLGLDWDVPPG